MPPRDRDKRDFRLGELLVQPSLGRISNSEGEVQLEPRTMELLVFFADNAGEVVSRREILDVVWGQEFVSDSTISGTLAKLRGALGDDARQPRFIETLSKRGYRLLLRPVHAIERLAGHGSEHVEDIAEGGHRQAVAVGYSELGGEVTPFPVRRREPERPLFVGRESELENLEVSLLRALSGEGQVVFIAGEAGTGKTALINELVRRSQSAHQELVPAVGLCSSQTGIGDAYGPWRKVLELLTGDVESGFAGGVIPAETARRLTQVAPLVPEAVVSSGRDLIGTLIPGTALVARAESSAPSDAPWLDPLRELVERKAALPPDAALQQAAVFMQVTRVLGEVARRQPLLLVIEDLQWSDAGSIALFFHVTREVAAHRVLIVGTYRPTDVAIGRGGDRHPLDEVVAELRGRHGKLVVDLDKAGDRAFVDAYVDAESNRLGDRFRESLFRQTTGHALFTVETLRTLQEREMIIRDPDGRWVESEDLDWGELPERVEGVVASRVDRLPEALRDLLTIASVEGEEFTAEIVAAVHGTDRRETIRLLSRDLESRHRLVKARGVRAVDNGRVSRFGFSHALFQRYLYGAVNEVERVQLHHDVGAELETLHGGDTEEVAAQLAQHFEKAGVLDKAVQYYYEAGQSSVHRTANREAIGHFQRALELLEGLPDSPERTGQELALQMAIQAPLITMFSWGDARVEQAAERAYNLVEKIGAEALMAPVLFQYAIFWGCARSVPRGIELGERLLGLSEEHGDQGGIILAHQLLGLLNASAGNFVRARDHFDEVLCRYDPAQHHPLALLSGLDPAVGSSAHLSWLTAQMGHLDQALQYKEKALQLAEELGHPHSHSMVHNSVPWAHYRRGEYEAARHHVEVFGELIRAHGFGSMAGFFEGHIGLLDIAEGRSDRTQQICARGVALQKMTGMKILNTVYLWILASAHIAAGDRDRALAALDEADEVMEAYGERLMESALLLCRADIALDLEDEIAAEKLMLDALRLAHDRHDGWHELQAAMALARLWRGQGKHREARELLKPVYGWFTEGLDTAPLIEARTLLDELESV